VGVRVLAIADDLTGALEAGAKFAARGMPSVVTTASANDYSEPVVVLDTESRHASPALAAAKVAGRAAGWDGLVYKKTDSTLRGNIGSELRALELLYGGPVAYVPAYPGMGRTVIDAFLYVHGVPLADTPFARDPLNPVRDGRVRSVLDPACDCVIFDGRTAADVDDAAGVILASESFRIVAGPAAIAEALAARLGSPSPIPWPSLGRCLVVNGSLHDTSRAQIRMAVDRGTISTGADSPWFLYEPDVPEGGDPLDIARSTGVEVARLLSSERFDAVLVFGGDTAHGLLESLGLPVLRPLGEILPGVPLSSIDKRREFIMTKAGGFGPPDLLARLRRRIG
jgi:uncharacterized protein YgbK (DUF1537 family)